MFNSQQSGAQWAETTLIYELFRALGDNLAATDQIAQQIRNAIVRQERLEWQAVTQSPVDEPQQDNNPREFPAQSTGEKPISTQGISEEFERKYNVGQTVRAHVVHIPLEYYGAIVLLDDGTKGLCHISEIAKAFLNPYSPGNRIEDHLQVGETYEFIIKKVNASRHELELSRLMALNQST